MDYYESIKRFKNLMESTSIDVKNTDGDATGIVHEDSDRIRNWIDKENIDNKARSVIEDLPLPISILKNINVENRGQGIGTKLLEKFIDESYDNEATAIILIADLGESQDKGFDLQKWYEGFGFEVIGKSSDNPVMMLNES